MNLNRRLISPTLKAIKVVFISIILALQVNAQPNKLQFNHITVEKGLSQSGVISIVQDHMGFMWFGTRDGLNKYDTQQIEIFKQKANDTTSLSSSLNIYALLSDSKGRLWVGTMSGLNLYQPETNTFKRFIHQPKNPRSISNNVIRCLFEDSQGQLWIGTDSGLNILNGKGEFNRILKQQSAKNSLADNSIKVIFQDKLSNIWVGTGNGLSKISRKGNQLYYQNFYANPKIAGNLIDDEITSIAADKKGSLWLSTHSGGISSFNYQTQKFTNLTRQNGPNSLVSNIVRKILFDRNNKLWIATIKGLNIYDPVTNKFQLYQHDSNDSKSLNQNSVYDIYQDKAGSIWIGTYFGGVNVYDANSTPFKIFNYKTSSNSVSSNIIRSIVEDSDKNLWIGTEGEGLNKYDVKIGKFSTYKSIPGNQNSLSSNLIKAIFIDKEGKIWIGSHDGGLDIFDPKKNIFTRYKGDPNDPQDLKAKDIQTIFYDSKGRFWVGTFNKGLYLFNKQEGKFRSLLLTKDALQFKVKFIKNLFEDNQRNLWVATDKGVFVLYNQSSAFKDMGSLLNLKSADVNLIQQDSKGKIWIGTYSNGLIAYHPIKHQSKQYTQANGLPSNNVLGILEDNYGYLWLSTDNGLSKFNGSNFKSYTVRDGLPGNVFNNNSYLKDKNGRLYFGGYMGLVSFIPSEIVENFSTSSIVFTGLKLFNKPVFINDENALLNKSINLTKKITFSHDQNIFTVEFALLNFIKSGKNQYAYKLDGFEKDWNYVNNPSATFTNLPPGTYQLMVKGKNNDGYWSKIPSVLEIKINPPFWQTWWAYIFYMLFIAGVLFLLFRYLIIRERLQKESEVHQMKLDFFTNVSHEIRTPLTLIMGPLENLLVYSQDNHFINKQLLLVKNNANRLSRLVNELLDFRKAEAGKLKLNIAASNVVSFVREIFLSFQHLASEHQIDYEFESKAQDIELYFDKEQLEKVVFNLLSNAFKFTPDKGKIEVSIIEDANYSYIRFKDNGKGVAQQDIDKLFTNFFQVEDLSKRNIGTGIGLALSKKIVTLHDGDISLETEGIDKGSVFTIKLRKGIQHFNKEEINMFDKSSEDASYYVIQDNNLNNDEDLPPTKDKLTILIAEDNPDVRSFIVQALKAYNTIEAENGLAGWDLATEHIPDIIISDIMMPELDGLEFCRRLKTDDRTSHIPVILLTARSGNIHQVSGLKTGADMYLTKPFSVKILVLSIKNLLASREQMRKKFTQQMTLQPTNVLIETNDQDFLNKVLNQIENNLSNPDFGVHELASVIGMSTPVFYKKIKSLTDMSVNNFIKSIRLKRAAQLLEQDVLTVYQVSYEVGFNDTRYFAKEFKKQYGRSPSLYAEKVADVEDENL
ncbi:sensor histidine kinase TodS [Pedobacter glucosidilyticus]|nr:hybrid sensor histidine kinase/response regulator transcription factor [Pedobacter glucosidilyticus]KHJ38722.1 sensor histidine kinase TodS [Pedobacter glucosidilyticus]